MQKISIRISARTTLPIRLDEALLTDPKISSLSPSKSAVRKWILAGLVYVNGKQVKVPARPLRGGEAIDIYLNPENTNPNSKKEYQVKVLYSDPYILCVEKPSGLPTQPTLDAKRENLFDLVKNKLKPKYLGMHHRLDRDTSGVILFTLDPECNEFISKQFKEHLCSKTYFAIVHGKPEKEEKKIESFLSEVDRKGKQARYGSVLSGGKRAVTHYTTVSTFNFKRQPCSLLKIKIETGRTHQIRVHLSEMGHPIIGDTLYGSPVANFNHFGRFLLHAEELKIKHPITKKELQIKSPIPKEFEL